MQSTFHTKHAECLLMFFADVVTIEQEETVLHRTNHRGLAQPKLGWTWRSMFCQSGSETPKWAL